MDKYLQILGVIKMANEFKHARYFRKRGNDSSLTTFSSVAEAKTALALNSAYDTNSPSKTETLEDSGQTLKVVYEFNSKADQDAMKAAVDALWNDAGGQPYAADDSSGSVEHFKTEWYATDGTTVDNTNNIGNIRK
jgi:hypothetical protein